jgi:hypothetical protein
MKYTSLICPAVAFDLDPFGGSAHGVDVTFHFPMKCMAFAESMAQNLPGRGYGIVVFSARKEIFVLGEDLC